MKPEGFGPRAEAPVCCAGTAGMYPAVRTTWAHPSRAPRLRARARVRAYGACLEDDLVQASGNMSPSRALVVTSGHPNAPTLHSLVCCIGHQTGGLPNRIGGKHPS